jgi:hypothetical protein
MSKSAVAIAKTEINPQNFRIRRLKADGIWIACQKGSEGKLYTEQVRTSGKERGDVFALEGHVGMMVCRRL